MIPLKFKRLWTVIGYGLVVGVVALSLIPVFIPPMIFSWADKLYHALAYGMLMLWFAQFHPKSRYWGLAGAFIMLGILMEVLQSQGTARSGEIWDVAASSFGTMVCWGLALQGMNTLLHRFEARYLKQGSKI